MVSDNTAKPLLPPRPNGETGQGQACAAVPTMLPEYERNLWLARRQSLLIELGAIEVYLGLERSVVPRHRRDEYALTRRDVIE